ncbi:MAG TPA: sugar phosphate nucleotidyltransferase [Clostridiales bacterium]|nr:MAG: Glucose-1-phosphate thymidylyltransferase [Firmicutes bacterium ADurb.Bin262]HOU10280.1 sugar phosphate nucleotidyltransferase [Clostridiales bacterium]HQH64421.1 sugar phosphate nucleotidyltransferase [Clostridiales bacterium]HQK73496.1 sugar phosphate nucleotidyltransferase [Clostridiales bacterium]
MKGLILAAGKGVRMKGLKGSKCLLPVRGTSLLERHIGRLLGMGIDDIIIVVGPRGGDVVRHARMSSAGARLRFAVQPAPAGIADAVRCAVPLLGKDDFALCLGDEMFYGDRPMEMLRFFSETGAHCICGVVPGEPAEEIRKCYTVMTDNQGNLLALEEKPRQPFNEFKGTGFCLFRAEALGPLGVLQPNPESGQYELCDWVAACIGAGLQCKVFAFAEREFNINTREDYENAEKYGRQEPESAEKNNSVGSAEEMGGLP